MSPHRVTDLRKLKQRRGKSVKGAGVRKDGPAWVEVGGSRGTKRLGPSGSHAQTNSAGGTRAGRNARQSSPASSKRGWSARSTPTTTHEPHQRSTRTRLDEPRSRPPAVFRSKTSSSSPRNLLHQRVLPQPIALPQGLPLRGASMNRALIGFALSLFSLLAASCEEEEEQSGKRGGRSRRLRRGAGVRRRSRAAARGAERGRTGARDGEVPGRGERGRGEGERQPARGKEG